MSKSLLLVLVALVGCRSKPDVAPQTAANARATAGLVQVVPLKYAAAPELAHTLNALLDAPRQSPRSTVVADARTNSLVVQVNSDRPADMERVVELIARLDVDATKPATATNAGSVRVVPLRHAVAAEVAHTLNQVMDASRKRAEPNGSVPTIGSVFDSRANALGEARIVADARTNSVVIQSDPDHPEDMNRIVEVIARLDVDVSKSN